MRFNAVLKMKKILLTGGIGSGKTTVCNLFSELGVPIYYSDVQAKRIINSNQEVISSLKFEFGENIYLPDGNIDRIKLSEIVFKDAQSLEKSNSIVHPQVAKDFEEWCDSKKDFDYIIQ